MVRYPACLFIRLIQTQALGCRPRPCPEYFLQHFATNPTPLWLMAVLSAKKSYIDPPVSSPFSKVMYQFSNISFVNYAHSHSRWRLIIILFPQSKLSAVVTPELNVEVILSSSKSNHHQYFAIFLTLLFSLHSCIYIHKYFVRFYRNTVTRNIPFSHTLFRLIDLELFPREHLIFFLTKEMLQIIPQDRQILFHLSNFFFLNVHCIYNYHSFNKYIMSAYYVPGDAALVLWQQNRIGQDRIELNFNLMLKTVK